MLKSMNPQFKNYQGDVFTQAVVVVEDAIVSKEEVKISKINIKRGTLENYEVSESEPDELQEQFSEVRYTAKYWMQISNFQQGNRGYLLEGAGGECEFTIDMSDAWCEKYNSIQGTDTQKITKLCDMHLEEVVLPELRAM